jgi:hypothetical protein
MRPHPAKPDSRMEDVELKNYFVSTPIAIQFDTTEQLNYLLNFFDRPGELYLLKGIVTFMRKPYIDQQRVKRISYVRQLLPQNTAYYHVISFADFMFIINPDTSVLDGLNGPGTATAIEV